MISGASDAKIKIWNPKSGECIKTLTGHKHKILCLRVLSGKRVASGSLKEIKVWNYEEGVCVHTIRVHKCWVRDILHLITPNNETLVSCSQDKTIKVWDLNRNSLVKTLTGHSGQVYCLLLLKTGLVASGSQDRTIRVWNVDSGVCVFTLQGHSDGVWALELTEKYELISCSSDKTIKMWSLNPTGCVKTLKESATCIKQYDGDLLLSGSGADYAIKLLNVETGEFTSTWLGHMKNINCFKFIEN